MGALSDRSRRFAHVSFLAMNDNTITISHFLLTSMLEMKKRRLFFPGLPSMPLPDCQFCCLHVLSPSQTAKWHICIRWSACSQGGEESDADDDCALRSSATRCRFAQEGAVSGMQCGCLPAGRSCQTPWDEPAFVGLSLFLTIRRLFSRAVLSIPRSL